MIPHKLFSRLTDMADDLALDPRNVELHRALVRFEDEIGWPFRASQQQLDEWNSKRIQNDAGMFAEVAAQ